MRRNWSLRIRLLITISIALSPVAIASFIQGLDRAQRDTENISERLLQTTRAAASGVENMLAASEQIMRALANLPAVRDGTAGCDHALSDALRGLVFFTDMARINRKGEVVCAARRAAVGRNVAGRPVWRRAKASGDFVVSEHIHSPLTDQPVIVAMLPMKNATGFDGALAIAIDVRWLDYMVHARHLPNGAVVAIFDRAGTIIATNHRTIAGPIFVHANATRRFSKDLYTTQDAQGRTWLYSTAALLGSDVYVGFAMRESKLFGATYIHVGTDFILPFAMLALSWFAIWLVTEREVSRWISYLRRVAAAYRGGHYALRPALGEAPDEFRMLGDAMAEMAAHIQDRDRRLHEALDQKSMLIREIHHRVKNNLQIVMSLLRLQARRVQDPAAADALKQARARINALALVHRILHEIEDLTTVEVKQLLSDLAEQTYEGFAGDRPELKVKLDLIERQVSGNLAVPLALFTVEALTNVFKHAYPDPNQSGAITVSLKPYGEDELSLTIADNGQGYADKTVERSVGARMIQTFGRQVGGHSSIRSEPGKGTVAELVFPDPAVHGGEAHLFGEP
jgi:two-component sensor histidine kinase